MPDECTKSGKGLDVNIAPSRRESPVESLGYNTMPAPGSLSGLAQGAYATYDTMLSIGGDIQGRLQELTKLFPRR